MSVAQTSPAPAWRKAGPPPLSSFERHRRQQIFAAARRHSRLVRRMRVLLPVAGLAIVVGLALFTRIGLPGDLDLSAARLSVTRNSIIMDNPHITGFDEDKREYTVSADRAVQPLLNPQKVRLEAINAKVTVADQGTATIAAESGDYDNTTGKLVLNGAIAMNSSQGYVLGMTGADIDLKTGTMSSQSPVSVGYQDSSTTGNSLSVTEGGNRIVLEGGVRTTLMPPRRPGPGPGPAGPPGD
jgi:lipopolysaccharide export system protein LptC